MEKATVFYLRLGSENPMTSRRKRFDHFFTQWLELSLQLTNPLIAFWRLSIQDFRPNRMHSKGLFS